MDKKEVFILGSGFSRAIHKDMPLLNNLTELVAKKIEEEDSIFKNIYEEYVKNRSIGNFEEILTYIYQDFPWKSEEERHLLYSLYIRLAEIAVDVIKERQETSGKKELFAQKHVKKFLNYLHITKTNVISLNYDTLLEELSMKLEPLRYNMEFTKKGGKNLKLKYFKDICGKYTSKEDKIRIKYDKERHFTIYLYDYNIERQAFERTINSFTNYQYKEDLDQLYSAFERKLKGKHIDYLDLYTIPIARAKSRTASLYGSEYYETYKLLKLHGSINWYYSAAKEKTTEQIYLFKSSKEEEKNLKDLVPVIIPPVLDKTGFFRHSTIKSMWNEAKNLLKEAKKVYIIGYSIPQTDLTVKFMLQSYISENCEIIIVNKKGGHYFKKLFWNKKLNEEFIRDGDTVFKDFVNSTLKIKVTK